MFVGGSAAVPESGKQSPETYLGARRAVNYGGNPSLIVDKQQDFQMPATLEKNHWALSGSWNVAAQTITSGSAL
jgi:hypothetical protein